MLYYISFPVHPLYFPGAENNFQFLKKYTKSGADVAREMLPNGKLFSAREQSDQIANSWFASLSRV